MKRGKPWAWIIFGLGALYFMLPLIATFIFSLRRCISISMSIVGSKRVTG